MIQPGRMLCSWNISCSIHPKLDNRHVHFIVSVVRFQILLSFFYSSNVYVLSQCTCRSEVLDDALATCVTFCTRVTFEVLVLDNTVLHGSFSPQTR